MSRLKAFLKTNPNTVIRWQFFSTKNFTTHYNFVYLKSQFSILITASLLCSLWLDVPKHRRCCWCFIRSLARCLSTLLAERLQSSIQYRTWKVEYDFTNVKLKGDGDVSFAPYLAKVGDLGGLREVWTTRWRSASAVRRRHRAFGCRCICC